MAGLLGIPSWLGIAVIHMFLDPYSQSEPFPSWPKGIQLRLKDSMDKLVPENAACPYSVE